MNDETALEKFKGLLRDLFRIDLQDLDFGIYKIMKAKQKMILDFIDNELVSSVNSILNETNEGEDLSEQVFNLAYEFFSRYYSNGDFIPQVRYGGKDKYMIPYNGQEIELYWATRNAYYVKTTEYFTNYSFVTFDPLEPNRKYNISFKIKEATLEKNYVASETKFFLLDEDPIQYSNDGLNIFFNYRPLTEDESIKLQSNDKTIKEVLKNDIEENLLKRVSDELKDILSAKSNENEIERSVLRRHLDIYFKKNESDYFIIKNLNVFLNSELENFIHKEILKFTPEFKVPENNVYLVKTISKICVKIIDQISQIEDFERKLWEKPKFIFNVNYVITLDKIASRENGINLIKRLTNSKEFDQQLSEWISLGIVNKNFSKDELFPPTIVPSINHKFKFLPIDTKYFKDTEYDLLSLFDDLDNQLNGTLIHSENYQAINTILPKFKDKVQTIYIDPPFNKEQDANYLYNVKYKDSTWASMLENRLILAKNLLRDNGSIFIRCDYNGNWIVRPLLNDIFGRGNFRNEIIVRRGSPKAGLFLQFENLKSIGVMYDNLYWYSKYKDKVYTKFLKNLDEKRESYWTSFKKIYDRPTMRYDVLGIDLKKGQWMWSKEKAYSAVDNYKKYLDTYKETNETLEDYALRTGTNEFVRRKDEAIQYWVKPKVDTLLDNNWTDIPGYSQTQGFSTENSEILLKRVIETTSKEGDLIIDFFLGSGTTTAVAHKLQRKWIGVEMGEHFHTIVLPRMKKVLAYDRGGVSKEDDVKKIYNDACAGGFFKYYNVEQYEDSINNINIDVDINKDYSNENLIRYILRAGMIESNLTINRKILSEPFNVKIKTMESGIEEEVKVNLVETFNIWYGIRVTRIYTFDDDRKYAFICGIKDNQGLMIIWRSTLNLDYNRDREFIVKILLEEIKIGINSNRLNQVLINSDATLDLSDYNINVRILDPIFYNMQFRDIHEE